MSEEKPEAAFEEKIRWSQRIWRYGPREILFLAGGIGLVVVSKFLPDSEHAPGWLAPYIAPLPWLGILSGSLLAALAIWRYRRRSVAPSFEPAALKPPAIKGPAAFGPADAEIFARLGRQHELAQLRAWILDDQVPLITLMGNSGAGKTSLLRAGLAYALGEGSRPVVYLEALPSEPSSDLLAAVRNSWDEEGDAPTALPDLPTALQRTARVVVIDQLEQLDAGRHEEIFELLRKIANQNPPYRSTWIVAFRREYSAAWRDFEISLPRQSLNRFQSISLREFSFDQAERVFAILAEAGEIPLTSEALRALLTGIVVDDEVSPVEIGISLLALSHLSTAAENRPFSAAELRDRGGREGLLAAYLERLLEVVPENERKEVLRGLLLLTDIDADRRVAEGLSVREIVERVNPVNSRSFERCLDFLASPKARVLEVRDGEKIRLLHDQWVPAVRRLCGLFLAQLSEAQRALKRGYSLWSEDRRARHLLRGSNLRRIVRNLSELHLRSQEAEFVRRSRVGARWRAALAACALLAVVIGAFLAKGQIDQRDLRRQFTSWGLPPDLPDYLGQLDELSIEGPINNLDWLSRYKLKSLDLRGSYDFASRTARIPDIVRNLGINSSSQSVEAPDALNRLDLVAPFPYISTSTRGIPRRLNALNLYTSAFPRYIPHAKDWAGWKFPYPTLRLPVGLETLRIFDPYGAEPWGLPKTLKTLCLTRSAEPDKSNSSTWQDLRPFSGNELRRFDLPLLENLSVTVEAGNIPDLIALSAFPRLRHLDLYLLPGKIPHVRFPVDFPLPRNITSVHLYLSTVDWATGRIELPSESSLIQALSLIGGKPVRLANEHVSFPSSLLYLDLGAVDIRQAASVRFPVGLQELVLGAQPVQSFNLPDGLRSLTLGRYGATAGWAFPNHLEALRIDFSSGLRPTELPRTLKVLDLALSQGRAYPDLREFPPNLERLQISPLGVTSLRGLPRSVRSLGLVTRPGLVNDWPAFLGSSNSE